MPKTASLRPTHLPSRSDGREWCLNVPATLSSTGKRQQLFFRTKLEAELEAELLKTRKINFGHSLCSLSAARIAEASACYARLDALKAPDISLSSAVNEFLIHYTARSSSVPMEVLFSTFLETKKSRSPNHQRNMRNFFDRVAVLNEKMVSDVGVKDLETVLELFPIGSRKKAATYLKTAFNFGIRRGWLLDNPITKLEFEPDIDSDEVIVIKPEIVEQLLFDALANDFALLPFLVFAFYAGIRPDGELQKLLWSDIDLTLKRHHVTVRTSVAKKRRKRWIDLSPNALAWLEAYRSRGGSMEGQVVPFSSSTLRRKRRRNALVAGITNWPQQGARHTYCSCWLRQHGDVNELVLQSGHTSASTMWDHYYAAVTPEAAAAFWSIYPPAAEERRVVAFPVTVSHR